MPKGKPDNTKASGGCGGVCEKLWSSCSKCVHIPIHLLCGFALQNNLSSSSYLKLCLYLERDCVGEPGNLGLSPDIDPSRLRYKPKGSTIFWKSPSKSWKSCSKINAHFVTFLPCSCYHFVTDQTPHVWYTHARCFGVIPGPAESNLLRRGDIFLIMLNFYFVLIYNA